MNGEELLRILTHMQEKDVRIAREQRLRDTRQRISAVRDQIDTVQVVVDGVMTGVDRRFEATRTFQPSTMISTQLRLAVNYLQAADEIGPCNSASPSPTLSSYVVLRAAIECTASAHWLLSGKNHRDSLERALKRMWWDTESAHEMASTADGDPARPELDKLEALITEICRPVKGLEAAKIVNSKRLPLSTIVNDAGAGLRPDYPRMMRAGWMLCSGIAHGNIPVSAGAGITAASVRNPSQHPIDQDAYAVVLEAVVEDVQRTTNLFAARAAEQHTHQKKPHGAGQSET